METATRPRVYWRERGPGPSVTGVPFSFFFFEQNVTDVLLVIPVCRDGPCPTTAVLPRISYSFHRWCRIARRFERLARYRVDLDVSELEAVLASLGCL